MIALFLSFLALLHSRDTLSNDSIYVTVQGDTATIWHTQSHRNCGSQFLMEVQITDSLITVWEVDVGDLAFCNCYFDLSVTIGPLATGNYTVEIYSTDSFGPYWGSTTFTIGGPGLLNHSQSECLSFREDSSSISLTVVGDTMTLDWYDIELNCCLEPGWNGWLTADTFQVTMTDTGPPCDCVCRFDLAASFGPFEPGTYTLNFRDGHYGYPTFTIDDNTQRDSLNVITQFQSDCYSMATDSTDFLPIKFTLHPNFPNPFNPVTTIKYELPRFSIVRLSIYDLLGRELAVLVEGSQPAGFYKARWNAKGFASGIYLYRLSGGFREEARKQVITRKLLLIK